MESFRLGRHGEKQGDAKKRHRPQDWQSIVSYAVDAHREERRLKDQARKKRKIAEQITGFEASCSRDDVPAPAASLHSCSRVVAAQAESLHSCFRPLVGAVILERADTSQLRQRASRLLSDGRSSGREPSQPL